MAKQKGLLGLQSTPRAIYTFIREARDELKKVSWPNRETTIRYTIIVVIVSVAVGFLIGGIDFLLQIILEQTI